MYVFTFSETDRAGLPTDTQPRGPVHPPALISRGSKLSHWNFRWSKDRRVYLLAFGRHIPRRHILPGALMSKGQADNNLVGFDDHQTEQQFVSLIKFQDHNVVMFGV